MSANYDMNTLTASAEFDAEQAASRFGSIQEYFEELDIFQTNWKLYLRLYNPTVVIYSPDECQRFLEDVETIFELVNKLGMTRVISELDNLREVVNEKNEKGLSDGLVKFFAALEITSGSISKAILKEAPVQPETPSVTAKPPGKPVIIAVDDRPEFLTLVMDIVGDEYKVIAMTDGNVALKAIEIYEPQLFLLDIEMPEMSGIEIAEKLRSIKRFESTPILFMTGNASREYVLSAKNFGVNEYLLKPVDRNTLLSKIKHYLE